MTDPLPVTLTASVKESGAAAFTVRVWAPDRPPPGAGVNTVTLRVPAVAMSPAGMAAVSWAALTMVVARLAPSSRTIEHGVKPEPSTVSVNPGPPAVREPGTIPVVAGAGRGAVTAKTLAPEAWAFVRAISRSLALTRLCELPPAPGTASTAAPPAAGTTTTSYVPDSR